jgi:hypothetical protein
MGDEDERAKQAEDLRETIATLRKGSSPAETPRDFTERGARKAREEEKGVEEERAENGEK